MKTLEIYFGWRFLTSFVRVFMIITLLVVLADTLEQIRSLSKHNTGLGDALFLAILHSPTLLAQALPFIVVLASLFFCLGLSRSNEFVISRASGMSALRSMLVPMGVACVVGILATAFLTPAVYRLGDQYDALRVKLKGSEDRIVSVENNNFWLRQQAEDGHTVIHAQAASTNGNQLREVTALLYDAAGNAKTRIEAKTALLHKDYWIFTQAKSWDIRKSSFNPEKDAVSVPIVRLATNVTPAQILRGYPSPNSVPVWKLGDYISDIESAGYSSIRHRLHRQLEFARPLMLMAMVLIGSVFMLQTSRLGNLGVSVLLTLTCGFSLHFLQNFAKSLGDAGEIPIMIAAWAPPLAALLFALGMILHLEDG